MRSLDQIILEYIKLYPNISSFFTPTEAGQLDHLQECFSRNYAELSINARRLEMERLGVDLSWKSSQIEGNTYSLLETERLQGAHEINHSPRIV